jgi:hypothetical protein
MTAYVVAIFSAVHLFSVSLAAATCVVNTSIAQLKIREMK